MTDALADMPTDERLKRLQGGETDAHLVETYFQFARYLLIASSRPGSMAANLQGKWNENIVPPWEKVGTPSISTPR